MLHNISCFVPFFHHILTYNSFYQFEWHQMSSILYVLLYGTQMHVIITSYSHLVDCNTMYYITIYLIQWWKVTKHFFTTYYYITHSTSIWMTTNVFNIIHILYCTQMHVIISSCSHFVDCNIKYCVTVYHIQWWKVTKLFFATYHCITHSTSIWMTINVFNINYIALLHPNACYYHML